MAPPLLEIRAGSTGAGLFVGCGAGLGLVSPISLHSIPVLGQLAGSLSASLGSLNHASGGLFSSARGRVRSLGVRGLDMGAGCGVMLGYGWGAGVFMTPQVLQSATAAVHSAGQQLLARLPKPLQASIREQQQQRQQQQQLATAVAASQGGMPQTPEAGSTQQPPGSGALVGAQPQQPQSSDPASDSSDGGSRKLGQQQQLRGTSRQDNDELAELTRLVLKQQNRIGDMEQTIGSLQASICKLDSKAPGCKRRS